jgi:Tfp pilus assembly protein PilN
MDLATFSLRIRRADFLDGLGIFVEPSRVTLAHVTKRFMRVALRHARSYPLVVTSPQDRLQSLEQAVASFTREFNVQPGAVHLCLGRHELLLNRIMLPAAARENLQQVLEYEVERIIPLPRDEIFYDYQVRESGGGEAGRLAVLVVSVPRRVVREYLDALELAGVRPKTVGIAAVALGDYAAFCRGPSDAPFAIMTPSGRDFELAVFVERQLIADHVLRDGLTPTAAELDEMIRRDLAEVFRAPEGEVEVLYAGAPLSAASVDGTPDLFTLAHGRLEAPPEFFESPEPALLPAVGAALAAAREGSVDVNLLPEEDRPGLQEGLLVPLILLVIVALLTLVYGGSVIVRDEMTRRALAHEVEALEPQVAVVKKQEAEARTLEAQLSTLTTDQDRRMINYLRELTDRIPTDAYLTTMRYRNGRVEIDGFATKASELIKTLEDSPLLRNVQFTSPTTAGQGGQERFSIVAEVEE